MDEQQTPKDVTDDSGEQAESGVNIQVKTATDTPTGPAINDIQAPPEPEVTIEEKDLDAVNTALQGISDSPIPEEDSADSAAEAVETPESQDNTQTESDVTNEPEVKEAPMQAEESGSQTEEKDEPAPDPFTQAATTASIPAATAAVPQSMSNNEQSLPHEHRNNKKFAVIITLVVALILAGAAVYVYISAQNNTSESAKSQTVVTPKPQVVEAIPATTADVEQTVTEIDETIKSIDDDTDLSEAAISDATLGL